MVLASELELPALDHTDPALRGELYRSAMSALAGYDGWLAANPFGYTVLEREAAEFFLRTREAVFPGLTIAQLFGIADGPLHEEIVRNIININGADHSRLRKLVNPALAPRAVQRYRPAMRRFMTQLLDGLPEDGHCEFVEEVAKPYPSLVIAEVMGAPLTDAPRLHHWSGMIQRQFDAASLMTERERIEEAVSEFYAYEDELIAQRRQSPGDDLISVLIQAEEQGDRLSHDELRNLILNILVGGVDTSQSQLVHTVRLLAGHPDQWKALRADPRGLALAAVDEALRYEPITPFTARITTEDIEYRGVVFPRGSIVLVSAWHANRQGIEPDRFDILADRPRTRVLTFGAGIHYCLGANLARAEMEEAVALLAEEVEEIHLEGPPELGTPSGIYGVDRLKLRLVASPATARRPPAAGE
ncbi:MAG TPA: cytochrome P450 [Solirubrobacteraceae bacterium]|nr:cytochrome P450 [Solirubrobacteraceae bacterium]